MYSEVYESNVKARVRLLFFKEIPQESPVLMTWTTLNALGV